MLENGLDPLVAVVERTLLREVEANDDAVGLLIERVSHRLVLLLSGCVPELDFEGRIVHNGPVKDIVDASGLDMRLGYGPLVEALQDRSLAHGSVTDNDDGYLVRFHTFTTINYTP